MTFAHSNVRAKGTGEIRRSRWPKHGWVAYSPQRGHVRGAKLGHFDTYRAAEKAIEAFIAGKQVA